MVLRSPEVRQLGVQEISPMIRHDLKPILFVINNSGYSIERYIHGKDRYATSSSRNDTPLKSLTQEI
jgi:TPP-dependent 2-oxoacid decarboxylase